MMLSNRLLYLPVLMLMFADVFCQSSYFNTIYENYPNYGGSYTRSVLTQGDEFISCGVANETQVNGGQIAIFKIDPEGNITLLKVYEDIGIDFDPGYSGSFKAYNDGFILGGSVQYAWGGLFHSMLWRFDHSFDTLFSRTYINPQSNFVRFTNTCLTQDGGIASCGYYETQDDSLDFILLKTDSLGLEQWRRLYSFGKYNTPYSVKQLTDGGYIISGISRAQGYETTDAIMFKTDSVGELVWSKVFDEGFFDGQAVFDECENGDILVSYSIGTDQLPPNPAPMPYMTLKLTKLSSNGSEIWTKTYGSPKGLNNVWKVSLLEDSCILMVGHSHFDTAYNNLHKGWLMKTDKQGDSLWFRYYSYSNLYSSENLIYDVCQTPDGGFLMGGEFKRIIAPGDRRKLWVLKVDSVGCLYPDCDPTIGYDDLQTIVNSRMSTYPNPFTTFTTIEYELSEISNIQFTIYNVIGEVVYQAVDRMMPQGKHSFTWSADRLPEGLYYGVLRSGEGVSVVKIIKQ